MSGTVRFWGYVTFFASLALLLLGKKVEQALEYAEWFMVAWIIVALLLLGIVFTSLNSWLTVITVSLAAAPTSSATQRAAC